MAESTMQRPGGAPLASIGTSWRRISPRFVPVLAVLSAMILTIPFMMITGARGDIGRGFNIALTAYAAFIEGAVGVAVNNLVTPADVALVTTFTENDPLTNRDLRLLARSVTRLSQLGADTVARYAAVIDAYADDLDAAALDALGQRIEAIQEVGPDTLRAMQPLAEGLVALGSSGAAAIFRTYGVLDTLTDEDVAAIVEQVPAAADYNMGDLQAYLSIINQRGSAVTISRMLEQLDVLDQLGIDPMSAEADDIAAISELAEGSRTGSDYINDLRGIDDRLLASGIVDENELSRQLSLVNAMYERGILTNPDVHTALTTELEPYLAANTVVYRPGNQPLLIHEGHTEAVGIIWATQNTPETEDDKPDTVYLRAGGSVFLFFPYQLERTIVRAIPFIIAGLAVALGFKAGLFNIGAEGQLYLGGLLAVFVGYSPVFDFLPGFTRVIVVLIAGVLGGALWGAIPGLLKAFAGAHEVINTIMMNYIALRLTDWLINSSDPYIMRDPNATNPSTPTVHPNSVLPRLDDIASWWFVAVAVIFFALQVYRHREAIQRNLALAIRPALRALLVLVAGLFLQWITVRDSLHLGIGVMILAVIFIDWLLVKTTTGFELRTVGTNPDAAKYAGMNVKWNIVLAMMLSGGLAGLAGAIEISSVQFNMKPAFFAGLGFDAIAVALLARSNPRNMIYAGMLWGSLVSAQGVIQIRTDISNDLVRIIQALIIMFIAADAIVRFLWRVPAASEEEKQSTGATFSKGWGG